MVTSGSETENHIKNEIENNIAAIRERIARAADRAGRAASEIGLTAVTKTRTVEEMLKAAPWVDAIGENRVQEAASKKSKWPGNGAAWRMIGHLQSNKVRKAAALFDTVDSVNSPELARALSRAAEENGRALPILIEINTSGEAGKTGAGPETFESLLCGVLASPYLKLEGLMTIGPLTGNEAQVRGAFAELREMASRARARSGLPLPVLSMGMSGDFEWAILEGSTMVRIGTALFGARRPG
ncbi:MAG: YggS family pyridoxal phosphate-dependent enzyme [Synergistaceae bacterium]|nr:YggS family pyridoxal phosphate-dependent enzyme [Synergistaceae bacterium]